MTETVDQMLYDLVLNSPQNHIKLEDRLDIKQSILQKFKALEEDYQDCREMLQSITNKTHKMGYPTTLEALKQLEAKLQAIDDYVMKNCDPEQVIAIDRIIKGEE